MVNSLEDLLLESEVHAAAVMFLGTWTKQCLSTITMQFVTKYNIVANHCDWIENVVGKFSFTKAKTVSQMTVNI